MPKQTKLVNCGSTIFVYDFDIRRIIKKLGFEQGLIRGSIIDLKRLLLTNFVDERLLVGFNLTMNLNEYDELQNRLNHFISQIQRCIGRSNIKYIAVLELPPETESTDVQINLITDIDDQELVLIGFDEELTEEQQEEQQIEHQENLWGNQLLIDVYTTPSELIKAFTSAYYNSLSNKVINRYPTVLFQSKLKRPLVLWNDKAEEFIRNQSLLDYPNHRSKEFYDKIRGFVISNVYSI
ncbi:hypothetical protein CN481_14200 [Bacillus sp. AFS006103]|nr:hypothetical protein CN481_14200 [Bacillus sp. AFS006103]